MLKKGVPIRFVNEDSAMCLVYRAIQAGNNSVFRIALITKLTQKRVSAAIYNLRTTRQIQVVYLEGRKPRYFIGEKIE
jgi:hypothetical protein